VDDVLEPTIPGAGRLVRLGLIFGASKLAAALISAAER
jgi:hypothetical protein